MNLKPWIVLALLLGLFISSLPLPAEAEEFKTPEWVKHAIFYQIFVDRFRNGNPANDPIGDGDSGDLLWKGWWGPYGGVGPFFWPPIFAKKMRWGEPVEVKIPPPAGWWREKEPYVRCLGRDWFGGDLQGVMEKIPYLVDLGITAIYFNPIFDSTDIHGYSVIDYKTINRYMGAPPRRENYPLDDPATQPRPKGKYGSYRVIPDYEGSLEVFKDLMTELDKYGIRVILDAVWNHCSAKNRWFDRDNDYPTLGAFESMESPWFELFSFIEWPWNYRGWAGFLNIPEIKHMDPWFRDYIYRDPENSVIKFWNDLGVDGWRLDVPMIMSHEFWEEFRQYYKRLNPEGYIVGERDHGPDPRMHSDFVQGDEWDSWMNYPWKHAVLTWASGGSVSEFHNMLGRIRETLPSEAFYAAFNILSCHDDPRALDVLKGDKRRMKLAVIFQMTYPGAPVIYYGDEVGMMGGPDPMGEGSRDPLNRQPYPWPDLGGSPDLDMFAHYKKLISIRKSYSVLRTGSLETRLVDDANGIYVLVRRDNSEAPLAVLIYNNSTSGRSVEVNVGDLVEDGTKLTDVLNDRTHVVEGGKIKLDIPGLWASILIKLPPIPTPELLSPTEGEVLKTTPTFEWSEVPGATYELQVDDERGFGSPELSVSLTEPTYTPELLPDGTYYWRVRARTAEGTGAWSPPRSFGVGVVLPVPEPLTPGREAELEVAPIFSWSRVEGVEGLRYELQVDDDVNFRTPELDLSLTETSYVPSLLERGVYYWRVRTRDAVGRASHWTEPQRFVMLPLPEVEVRLPPRESKFSSWILTGRAQPGTRIEVKLQGVKVGETRAGPDNGFSLPITLSRGFNELEVIAFDNLGRVIARSVQRVVYLRPEAPVLTAQAIEAGGSHSFGFEPFELPVTSITLRARNNIQMPSVLVEPLEEAPFGVPLPAIPVYKYFNLETNVDSKDLSAIVVRFRVAKPWVAEEGVDGSKVELWRFSEEWQPVWTELVGEDGEFLYYLAEAETLSLFAVVGHPLPGPGLAYFAGVWVSFFGLGVLAYSLGRVVSRRIRR